MVKQTTCFLSKSPTVYHGNTKTGFFGLYHFHTPAQNIDKLRQLRLENTTELVDFFVGEIEWTPELALELIQTFDYYAIQKHARWNEGRFHTNFTEFMGQILKAAMPLFRKLRFAGTHGMHAEPTSSMQVEYATALMRALPLAQGLERLTIWDFDISSQAASLLGKGLLAAAACGRGPCELVLDGNRFEATTSNGIQHHDQHHAVLDLAQGLKAATKTLQRLVIRSAYWTDSVTAAFFSEANLLGLTALQVSYCDFSKETLGAIRRILSHPHCKWQELELSNHVDMSYNEEHGHYSNRPFDVQALFVEHQDDHVMPSVLHSTFTCSSLQSLCLSKQGLTNESVQILLRNISCTFPNLRHLDLQLNQIHDLNVGDLLGPWWSSCLQTIDLDYNDCFAIRRTKPQQQQQQQQQQDYFAEPPADNDDDIMQMDNNDNDDEYQRRRREQIYHALFVLLQAFPQLSHFGHYDFKAFLETSLPIPPLVEHQLDMNRAGGFLLHHHVDNDRKVLPLSAWSLVLERTNRVLYYPPHPCPTPRRRQANVIYHLLREGPAFGGRFALS